MTEPIAPVVRRPRAAVLGLTPVSGPGSTALSSLLGEEEEEVEEMEVEEETVEVEVEVEEEEKRVR
jgi:hypothetical protein